MNLYYLCPSIIWYSKSQYDLVWHGTLRYVQVYGTAVLDTKARSGMLGNGMVWWRGMVCWGTARYCVGRQCRVWYRMSWQRNVWTDIARYRVVWYGMMWQRYGQSWCGIIWCGMLRHIVLWHDVGLVWHKVLWCLIRPYNHILHSTNYTYDWYCIWRGVKRSRRRYSKHNKIYWVFTITVV